MEERTPELRTLTGGVWQAEESLDITITNDALDEDDETFDLEIEYQPGTQHPPLVDADGNSCGSKCTGHGDGGGRDRGRLHGGPRQPADGECLDLHRRSVWHGRHRSAESNNFYDRELGYGPDGDGDGRRRCGPDERHWSC